MSNRLDTKLYWSRRLTWASYCLLILFLLMGGAVSSTPASLLVIAVLPLFLFLPGMARENPRSLIMLCFVTLLYFTVIVVNIGEPDGNAFDYLALVCVVVLFVSAMMLSRWLQQRQNGHTEPETR